MNVTHLLSLVWETLIRQHGVYGPALIAGKYRTALHMLSIRHPELEREIMELLQ